MASVYLSEINSSYSGWLNGGEDYITMSSKNLSVSGRFQSVSISNTQYISKIEISCYVRKYTDSGSWMGNCYNGIILKNNSNEKIIDPPGQSDYTKLPYNFTQKILYSITDTEKLNILTPFVKTGLYVDLFFHADSTGSFSNWYRYGAKDFRMDVTLVDKPQYNITIQASPVQGGSASGEGIYYQGQVATISATAASGYTWAGWNDGSSENPRSITVSSDITLTANFSPITYSVSFNNNGGSGSMNNQDFAYDTAENLTSIGNSMIGPVVKLTYNYNDYITSNSEDESNKVFSYWYDNEDKNNSNKWYSNGQEVINLRSTNGATVPLYAQWGDAFFTLEAPSRKYHQFLNWTDGTNIYNAGDTASFSANTTLTAQWKKNQYRAFSGVDNIEKMYLSKNKKIEKIFVGTTEV